MNKWRLIGLLSGVALILLILTAISFSNDFKNYESESYQVVINESIDFEEQDFLNIDMSSEDVVFYATESEAFEVTYTKTANSKEDKQRIIDEFVIESSNDGIRIYQKNRQLNWWNELREHFLKDILDVANNQKSKLEVGLPESFVGDLTVDISSGNVVLGQHEFANLIIDLSSGEVQIDEVNCQTLTLEASSGDMNVDNIVVEGKTIVDASSGNINLTNFEGDELSIELSSGDTTLSGKVNSLNYDASSGRLEAIDFFASESYLDTSSGDIDIQGNPGNVKAYLSSGRIVLDYDTFDNNIWIDVSSGEVIITLPSDAEYNIEALTSSGDFQSDFDIVSTINEGIDENHIIGQVGSSDNEIYIDTSSGDIEIKIKE